MESSILKITGIFLAFFVFHSCLYEPYSKAYITNGTKEIITLTFHLDTAQITDKSWHKKHPQDAFLIGQDEKMTIDSLDNLIGMAEVIPNQSIIIFEGMSSRPVYWFDKLSIISSSQNIVLSNETAIKNAFVKKGSTFEFRIE